jgi:hypothetical protein
MYLVERFLVGTISQKSSQESSLLKLDLSLSKAQC